jgi:hypothetical protein
MLGVYTIVKPAADHGWGSAHGLGLGAASLLLLVAFVAREARAANPLCPASNLHAEAEVARPAEPVRAETAYSEAT